MNRQNNSAENRNMIILSLVILLLAFAGVAMARYYFVAGRGPEQPIHFSHRIHATQKNISCFMCHNGAMETARAGVPPLHLYLFYLLRKYFPGRITGS
jgi:hypothetical protein